MNEHKNRNHERIKAWRKQDTITNADITTLVFYLAEPCNEPLDLSSGGEKGSAFENECFEFLRFEEIQINQIDINDFDDIEQILEDEEQTIFVLDDFKQPVNNQKLYPICVDENYCLIDGWHRIFAHTILNKDDKVVKVAIYKHKKQGG